VVTDFDKVMEAGRSLDLDGCSYGVWHDDFVTSPHDYYYFLAGLVRTRRFAQIVEIGTHYGGAITAMSRGITEHDRCESRLVTVDITNLNQHTLAGVPHLRRIQGDSLQPSVVRRVCRHFAGGPIDLLYVDSRHERRETMENIAIYANRLRPQVIVVDDINLNREMRQLWLDIVALDPGVTSDVSLLVNRRSAGFGVIECREGVRWPELGRARRSAWHAYRRARRTLGPHLPSRARSLLRSSRSWRSRS
jgi:hypothetical protein